MYRQFSLILPIILLGCESILEIELERPDPEIVVTSVFTENRPWEVAIKRTVGIQENALHSSIIDDAIVTIDGSDGSFLELIHKGGGLYYGDTSLPQSGVVYRLKVKADGFRSVEATDQIPAPARIPSVQRQQNEGRSEITLFDEAGMENYYAISILSQSMYWQRFSVLNPELDNQMKRLAIQDPFSPYADQPDVPIALIHDRPFDGKHFNLSLSTYDWERNSTTYVRAVSKAYYDYFLSKIVQKNAESLTIVEPAPVRSNINGGRGIFAGYRLYVDGGLPPEKMREQITGSYNLTDIQTYPPSSTIQAPIIKFTLHRDQSVTGFMKYPERGDSVLVSLGGRFSFTDYGPPELEVHLYHDADTFFRSVGLGIVSNPNRSGVSLSATLEATGNGDQINITYSFRKESNR